MVKPATVAEEAQALAQWLGGGQELARWLGDGQGLLARLQENYEAMWRLGELKRQRYEQRELVHKLIRRAVEHMKELP